MGQWLSAFVDDEPETVDALRSGGVRAHSFDELSGLRVRELRATLSIGNRGPRAVKGTPRYGVPRRRRGTAMQGAR
ncbi:hypothetical protein Rhow_002332 [Rhodococcus wratislaviensis]|uniref:Uncharacterized protein n=1 Tax=Rhodococcus wratislaviensis TaxID=44752 RepID=A0A402C5G7_RHOWR|nr:hypothetical protein [Rhodococcus wratislaviensis]GCE38808.1 hypothetical protein Rhow_002332 [Rhodococcus wratislaviensis]